MHKDFVVCLYHERDDQGLALVLGPKKLKKGMIFSSKLRRGLIMVRVNIDRFMNIWNHWKKCVHVSGVSILTHSKTRSKT